MMLCMHACMHVVQRTITLAGKELCPYQHYSRHLARGTAESQGQKVYVTSSVGDVKITPHSSCNISHDQPDTF